MKIGSLVEKTFIGIECWTVRKCVGLEFEILKLNKNKRIKLADVACLIIYL
jgi:hypothetical protein